MADEEEGEREDGAQHRRGERREEGGQAREQHQLHVDPRGGDEDADLRPPAVPVGKVHEEEDRRHRERREQKGDAQSERLPEDELEAPHRLGEEDVDRLPVHFVADEGDPEEDRHDDPEYVDAGQPHVGDDPGEVADRQVGEEEGHADDEEGEGQDRVEDLVPDRLPEGVGGDGEDSPEHVRTPPPSRRSSRHAP